MGSTVELHSALARTWFKSGTWK